MSILKGERIIAGGKDAVHEFAKDKTIRVKGLIVDHPPHFGLVAEESDFLVKALFFRGWR
jgi:hypothetical protein